MCGIDRKGMEGLSTRITSVVTEGGISESCSECKGLPGKNPFMLFRQSPVQREFDNFDKAINLSMLNYI